MGGQRQSHQARALMLPAYYIDRMMPVPDGCVLWTGPLSVDGYGITQQKDDRGRMAHRVVWELTHGPIAGGLQIDHLCRVRSCVKVAHLEPVTPAVNHRRALGMPEDGATCRLGHAGRWYVTPGTGERHCHTCKDELNRQARHRTA